MRQQRTAHFLHKSSTSLRSMSQRARAVSFRAYCLGGVQADPGPTLAPLTVCLVLASRCDGTASGRAPASDPYIS